MASQPNRFHLQIASRTDNLGVIRLFIGDIARKAGFNEDTISDIELAVDEACTNVIKHAYHYDANQQIDIAVELNDRQMAIVISDHGSGFDPDSIENPDQRIRKHARGGLGIALMKKIMDEVSFSIQPGIRNEVRMIKYK